MKNKKKKEEKPENRKKNTSSKLKIYKHKYTVTKRCSEEMW